MAKTISIELSDSEYKALEYVNDTPESWSDNAVKNRIRIATDEIVALYTEKALDGGITIPSSRAEIIDDAYARGWIKTAKQRVADENARLP
tara:strand:- start:18 stop:290 length:273 start_codon:yes stop_codon:yes gene_type:complete